MSTIPPASSYTRLTFQCRREGDSGRSICGTRALSDLPLISATVSSGMHPSHTAPSHSIPSLRDARSTIGYGLITSFRLFRSRLETFQGYSSPSSHCVRMPDRAASGDRQRRTVLRHPEDQAISNDVLNIQLQGCAAGGIEQCVPWTIGRGSLIVWMLVILKPTPRPILDQSWKRIEEQSFSS